MVEVSFYNMCSITLSIWIKQNIIKVIKPGYRKGYYDEKFKEESDPKSNDKIGSDFTCSLTTLLISELEIICKSNDKLGRDFAVLLLCVVDFWISNNLCSHLVTCAC
jgi:hypothetical protein